MSLTGTLKTPDSLSTLGDVPFKLQPSDACAAAMVEDFNHRMVGHVFYYPEQIKDIRSRFLDVDSETQFAIGKVPIGGEDYGYEGICLFTEGEEGEEGEDSPPIILVEGSDHVMDFVLNEMYPLRENDGEIKLPVSLSAIELSDAIEVLSNLVTGDIKYVGGIVCDVISVETGQSVGPVLLRDQMIQELLSGFKEIEEGIDEEIEQRPVEIGLGSVRPEKNPNEVTLYVSPVDLQQGIQESDFDELAPTSIAVGPESIIRDFLCFLSPTWVKQIGPDKEVIEVPFDEARQLVEWLNMVCTMEGSVTVVDP